MPIHLFIDTNVYLKFYHYSKDDIEQLSKLLVLMDNSELSLYLPEQVINEFNRNRENKLNDALKSFTQSKIDNKFPQFCKDYEEYTSLRKIAQNHDIQKKSLLKKVMDSIKTNSLAADKMIASLFQKANVLEFNSELIKRSRIRFDLGNPPGKNKSLGDAIIWETLIENIGSGIDLNFITDDKDYFSEINDSRFNTFLLNEWMQKKDSNIIFNKTLSDFFKDTFPDIKLATELEKDILIAQLIDSQNFYDSRSILQKLTKFDSFSSEQANNYISACMNNTQIFWISQDEDINEYLHNFTEKNKEIMDKELVTIFYEKVPKKLDLIFDEDSIELPF